jgi:hypothetical protein
VRAAVPRWSITGVAPTHQYDWLWALTSLVAALVPPHMGLHDHLLLLFPGWILAHYAVSGGWSRAYSALWFALLWSGYAVALLALFVEETPAVMVVPGVSLLLIMMIVLMRHIYASSVNVQLGNEPILLPQPAS